MVDAVGFIAEDLSPTWQVEVALIEQGASPRCRGKAEAPSGNRLLARR